MGLSSLASELGHLTRMALGVVGGKALSWEVPVQGEGVWAGGQTTSLAVSMGISGRPWVDLSWPLCPAAGRDPG